jgi:hypothetical protein
MKRVSSLLLASSLAIMPSTTATAQQYVFPGTVVDGGGFVDGSFGGYYVQRPPLSGVPGNRWNMLGGLTYPNGVIYPEAYLDPDNAVTPPGTVITQPQPLVGPPQEAEAQPQPQPAAAPQPRNVVVRRGLLGRRRVYTQAAGGPAPYRTPLPQTRIYGDGSIMAPNGYSPANRVQTYGEGYDLGPYGSNYYSEFYQGRPVYP